jgi:2',3'-cyclic-nucleotide 2'-phosphodiesterase (5'-nucleotidase family)
MKRIPVVFAAILCFFASSFFSPAASETVDLTILHINDFHGNLLPKPARRRGNGGYHPAKMVTEEREKNPEGTLLFPQGTCSGTPI